ncbi:cytochrome P450 [Streptomyces sp. NBC_00859]|uniref:cytochrome P450 n=1 Tax=Streptomyces sp. NBC_00859 TaxID=2903682 RepID=UPI003868C6C4|nr:cytochrome P450 [Streptomyces sp. NBC_00859]
MTTHRSPGPGQAPAPGCPVGRGADPTPQGRLIPIHGPDFSANPGATYAALRKLGPIAPVEIAPGVAGYLTTTYRAALHLLRNTPSLFAKNPEHWVALRSGQVPADSPAAVMMMPRDNALWMDGAAHTRLRSAITDSLAQVDTHALTEMVTQVADELIDAFVEQGEVDLVAQYTEPLPMLVLARLFGCSPDITRDLLTSIAMLFDTDENAAEANAAVLKACMALITLKQRRPGRDITSWLLAHPTRLTDEEMTQQILLTVGAASTPSTNLSSNALALIHGEKEIRGGLFEGVMPVSDAVDHVLWTDPPVSNYSPLYALTYQAYEGVTLPPGVPILVSFAAANGDPEHHMTGNQYVGNRGHLAFSAGVHGCPAPGLARVIAETAIERVLDRLPDLTLSCRPEQLVRRPGTFHSGWTSLPFTFEPTAPSTRASATPASSTTV